MKFPCPSCREALELNLGMLQSPYETACGQCHMQIRIRWNIQVEAIGPSPQITGKSPSLSASQTFDRQTGSKNPTVLLAVDGDASRNAIREILEKGGLSVLEAMNGREALELLQKDPPSVTLLDVELPQVLGFQVCEVIKKSPLLKNIGVILVASIYDKTRYKREPKNLYGADDYIERHQINDELLGKIKKLLDKQGIPWKGAPAGFKDKIPEPSEQGPPSESMVREPKGRAVGPAGNAGISPPKTSVGTGREERPVGFSDSTPSTGRPQEFQKTAASENGELSPQHTEAQRLARIIISDIALYNQKNVEEGLRKGNFTELLKSELEEGRKLYQERVPEVIQHSTNYFDEALQEFISKRTQTVK